MPASLRPTRRRRRRPGWTGTTEPLFFSAAFPNRFFTTTTSVWCRASCQMARGNERGRSAGCSPITSSRTATAVPARVTDKGNVEGVVGYARRNFMTPRPRFASWDAFNGHLEEQCRNRQGNVLRGHRESIGERFVRDREALKRPLPAPFDACDKQGTRVNSLSLVRYRTNDYSVPVAYGHQEVWIRGYVHEVVIGCGAGDHCPTPPFLRPGRHGLRSDPLPAFAGAQDRCPGSGRAASRMGTA